MSNRILSHTDRSRLMAELIAIEAERQQRSLKGSFMERQFPVAIFIVVMFGISAGLIAFGVCL